MVDGELNALVILNDVGPAVANIADNQPFAIAGCDDGRGSHPLVCGHLALFPNICICRANRLQEPCADRDLRRGGFRKGFENSCYGHCTCDFAACHSSHSIADDIDAVRFVVAASVFIIGAHASNIAENGDYELQRCWATLLLKRRES